MYGSYDYAWYLAIALSIFAGLIHLPIREQAIDRIQKQKLKFNPYLEKLYQSDKAMIIYKVNNGYNIYTDFSKKIILTNNNIYKFLNNFNKKNKKETDLYLGFFGYEILCNLLNVKIKKQKKLNFYKGIFYKPETIIKIER